MSSPLVTPAEALERRLGRRLGRDRLLGDLRDLARAADAEVWLVGGYVRDAALGESPEDVDLVGGAGCARMVKAMQRHFGQRGFRFTKRGVTTWRFHVAQRGCDLVVASRRGLRRDLERRELTINAIAWSLRSGKVVDPLGGLSDLRIGRLRLPRPGILCDDPARVLRLCRFLARWPTFRPGRAIVSEATRVAPRLVRTPVERVRQELDKLLLAEDPRRGLDWIARLGALAALLPELVAMTDCSAGRGRPDVWHHTLDALSVAATPRRLPGMPRTETDTDALVLRWALLLHDVSKPETLAFREDVRPTFHGHESLGARRAESLLRRLRCPRSLRRRICRLVLLHLRPGHLADSGASPAALRRLARDSGGDLPLLVVHAACDAKASGGPEDRARWRRLRAVFDALLRIRERRARALPKLIDGRDVMRLLGIDSGPGVGAVLARIRSLQERGIVRTREEALDRIRAAT